MILGGLTLYAVMAVLGVLVLQFAYGLLRAVLKQDTSFKFATNFLNDILNYVLPLLVLVYLLRIDPTGLILLIVFLLTALAVFLKLLIGLANMLRK